MERQETLSSIGLLVLRLGAGGYMALHGWGKVEWVLAGDFENQYRETFVGDGVVNDIKEDSTRAVPVLEVALGLSYDLGPVQFSAGYEFANWFNLADRPIMVDDAAASHNTGDTSDLLVEGLFLCLSYTH